jgi:hypothetical protein
MLSDYANFGFLHFDAGPVAWRYHLLNVHCMIALRTVSLPPTYDQLQSNLDNQENAVRRGRHCDVWYRDTQHSHGSSEIERSVKKKGRGESPGPEGNYYHLTQCGRAHDCRAKGRRFKSRHRRFLNQPYLLAVMGFVGTWGESWEGVKLGSNPRKADENHSLSHRVKSNHFTLAAKRTVKSS